MASHSQQPYMSRSKLLRMLPSGANEALLFFILGAAYGLGISALWKSDRISGAGSTKVNKGVRPRVVCFGDSLTQFGFDPERLGWLALLSHWWERRFDVVNRGFSGYNTRWLLPLVDKLFTTDGSAETKLVTIFLGANDCVLPGNAQYVPIDEYKDSLKQIVSHVRKVLPAARVLLISPPPIHEAKWAEHRGLQARDMDRRQDTTMSYAKACLEVGQEVSARVVDAYTLMGGGDETLADKYLHDGVHFTSDGNRLLFEAVQKEIRLSFPELDPDNEAGASMQAPHWADVNPVNHRESVLKDWLKDE